jgi:hypothetical protein
VTEPAYAHYTVERETSESEASRVEMRRNVFRKGWKAVKHRATYRLPNADPGPRADADISVIVRDVVRILDRDRRVVRETVVAGRALSETLQTEITHDLLTLDVAAFRAKYGIDSAAQG